MDAPSAAAAVIDYILDDNTDEKLKDLFDFYDADGNGMIQRSELIDVLALCAHEIGLDVDAYLEQIADAVFSNANLTPCGSINFESLKEVLKKRPNLINELSLARCLNQASSTTTTTTSASASATMTTTALNQHQQNNRGQNNGQTKFTDRIVNFALLKWDAMADCLSKRVPICNKLRVEYISNNLTRCSLFLGLVAISLGLIVGRIYSYWTQCGFLITARSTGQCLNFFCSIIVLLVCRRSISVLRSRGWGRYLPLDDHVYFHKMIGIFIVIHSIVHTFGHILNFLVISNEPDSKFTWAEYLFGLHTGIGWIGGCASISGWLLLLIVFIMSLAQPFARSLGKFELFYYTHLLYIPFWALLFIHAPHFWIWFLGPFLVFTFETMIRLRKLITNLTTSGRTTIIKAVPLPSNVIHLVIKKPVNFEYNPGDWIYVLIPQIAKYEWHPFTISSAPEQEGVIWLHIRAVGEWTRSLRAFFECFEDRNHLKGFIRSGQFSMSMEQFSTTVDLSTTDSAQILGAAKVRDRIHKLKTSTSLAPIPENKSVTSIESQVFSSCESPSSRVLQHQGSSTANIRISRQIPNITVFIDGPYGSPSSQIFRAEHAVLIATGIGVTPFASILQSIVHHYEKRRQKCPNCAHEFSDPRPPVVCKLRKVDFVWINRDQKSFEWFIKLLAELELTQSHLPPNDRFLDIHIHLTAMEPSKTKSIGLQLALYLVHEKNKKDLVTGLRTRTKAGRPNWHEFFSKIEDQKKGKVSVFFCGSPNLARLLHRQCDSLGFKFRKEIF